VEESSFAARFGRNHQKSMKYTHLLSYCQNKQKIRQGKAAFILFFFSCSTYYLAERAHKEEDSQNEKDHQQYAKPR
jgi:hypothetical protein